MDIDLLLSLYYYSNYINFIKCKKTTIQLLYLYN